MDVSLTCMFSSKNYLYKFYDFFCRQHSLTNRPTYNDLFHIMQHDNIGNINNVIFTQWKHLEFRVNVFWYYLNVTGRYTFHCNKARTHNHLVRERTLNIWLNGWVLVYKLSGYGFKFRCFHFQITRLLNAEFLDIQAATEYRFILKTQVTR